MACNAPLRAYRTPGGISFSPRDGYRDLPLELPCGQCKGCRIARSEAWALRCVHEASLHERNSFVTLTYAPEHVPEDLGLHVEDLQKCVRSLRKRGLRFRYFACGEYGSENLRPHFHAILFGVDFSEDRTLLRSQAGRRLYRSELLDAAWSKGYASVGGVSYASAAYVARYTIKKVTGRLQEFAYWRYNPTTGECWQVRPEFAVMSRRPGIGTEWLSRYESDVYPSDGVVHEGRRRRPPRFYDEQLGKRDPAALDELKARRRAAVSARKDDLSQDRLDAREAILASQESLYGRKL